MATQDEHNTTESSDFNPTPWVVGVFLVLGLAIMAGFYWKRTLVTKDVQYSGHYFVTQQELASAAEVPTGISPDSVDFMSLITKLETVPYVKQADISVRPSGNLDIQITERQPIALLANGENKIYVDSAGIRLPRILGKTVDVPIVYGFKTSPMSDTLKSEAWKQTRNFLAEIRKSSFSHATISEIAWTSKEGIVALSHENGVKLLFGRNGFSKKLRNWEAFYAEVIREKGIQKMKSVDFRFEGQIVTRQS